ncbi:MAG: Type 1 glutamine amidotransferase-like domain-containing protein [Clostridia bacterium]|nr:Type 1 glutamine amidotransferase-like domain-containing protein [Clostridia bacterium]
MGRVFAISGFSPSRTKLFSHAVKLTRKEHPNVLYIGTAGGDAPERIANTEETFGAFGCEVRALSLTVRRYSDAEMDALLDWADLIYVGGGDTVTMMRIWRENGLDKRLAEIYRTDAAVLSGVSAGAICWFACGHSDSESFHKSEGWHFCWADGMLDLFHKVYCPHYNDPGRDSFDEMLREKNMEGLALENGAAFVEDGDGQYFVRADEGVHAYSLSYENGVLKKTSLPIRDL